MNNNKNILQKGIDAVLMEIFPKDIKCIFCGRDVFDDSNVCPECLEQLPFNNKKFCARCGTPIHTLASHCSYCKELPFAFKKARSPFVYAPPISDAIRKMKYTNAKYVVETLTRYMAEEYILQGFSCDVVVPVPLHPKREKERGFNQSALIGVAVAEKLGLPFVEDALKRVVETPTQTALTRKQREKNLENAFVVEDKNLIKNKTILLIDDVFTTGATMNFCSEALVNGGASEVFCLSIAHSDYGKQKRKKK